MLDTNIDVNISITPNFDVLKTEGEKLVNTFLTPHQNIISNEELREILNPNEIEALDTFKKDHPNLVKEHRDIFIMMFIWARKLDLKRTQELMVKHYEWREKYDIDNLNFEWIREMFLMGFTYGPQIDGIDCVDKKGRMLSFILPEKMMHHPELANDKNLVKKMMHYSWWTLERIFYQKKYASYFRDGVVYLEDFEGVAFMKITKIMDRSVMKESMSMQDAVPLRIRGIILYNPPTWIRFLIAIAKPFMKKKLSKKVSVIKSRQELSEVVSDENLPTFLGGSLVFDTEEYAIREFGKK
eukprot:TRINITY_DN1025_c0_g1_i1.p1 TRINITY_DN1025_c0_g1~~TRINITY_DN1025_c0_g1_i1.p1  ORF type:complete len:298 (-),score=93.43 TRINITY_DN1025_c0_g1_i1:108-1001(-)